VCLKYRTYRKLRSKMASILVDYLSQLVFLKECRSRCFFKKSLARIRARINARINARVRRTNENCRGTGCLATTYPERHESRSVSAESRAQYALLRHRKSTEALRVA
jgi:hypothetical protein